MIVCGDLNASHPAWSPSGKKTGGNALQELIVPMQRREPRKPDPTTLGNILLKGRGKQQRPGRFELRASRGITHPFPMADGSMSGSTIDLMLIYGWKGKLPPTPTIITSLPACASDHLPIAVQITRKREGEQEGEDDLPTLTPQTQLGGGRYREESLQKRASETRREA